MFQKDFKKGALPARKVSPLMPINCLIKRLINFWTNREQFMNNSCSILVQSLFNPCSILVQSLFKQSIRVPKNNSCFQNKMKAAVMNPFMSILGEERRRRAPKKTNNFERFFGDSALTFLTFGNTFRLQILPTRCLVLLRGRERKIWGRQIKIRGRQIFPGCAPKIAVFKGKVTKKGGSRGSSHISIQI